MASSGRGNARMFYINMIKTFALFLYFCTVSFVQVPKVYKERYIALVIQAECMSLAVKT
jgi:hypothetical protein